MRALGPGSVSSFLKIVVEVIYVGLCIGAAALLIGAMATLVLQPFAGLVMNVDLGPFSADVEREPLRPLPVSLALLTLAAYAAGLVVVFNRLRRVFATLTLGDPFHPHNVTRLRVIGLALIALELIGGVLKYALAYAFPHRGQPSMSLNLTAWFAILVVFVLAEVFREGARLRRDAELTV